MALFLWSLLITDKCKGQDIGIQLGTKGINCFPLYPIIKIDEEQQICQYKTVQIVDIYCGWTIMRERSLPVLYFHIPKGTKREEHMKRNCWGITSKNITGVKICP